MYGNDGAGYIKSASTAFYRSWLPQLLSPSNIFYLQTLNFKIVKSFPILSNHLINGLFLFRDLAGFECQDLSGIIFRTSQEMARLTKYITTDDLFDLWLSMESVQFQTILFQHPLLALGDLDCFEDFPLKHIQ
ncbi:hypothetical protein CEXT_487721 [Caerostris extrusa]|uniref:Uncharacterized protein n=1 Tax=Caerostris extrusa TaxID=172846 RepID=A0AAV4Q8F5_CAEEX|nr:hypothetical protein CEXT_487721 [Caerostris extrusa]